MNSSLAAMKQTVCFGLHTKGIQPLLCFHCFFNQSPVLLVGEPSLHPDVNQINGTCFTRGYHPIFITACLYSNSVIILMLIKPLG